MKTRIVVAVLLVLAFAVPGFAQKTPASPKATVVHLDKSVDFAAFKTYSYEKGQPAIVKEADARIVAGIEAQLASLGLTKAASGPGDVVVTYYSVERMDVDLATFDKVAPAPGAERKPAQTVKVGTLVVDMKQPGKTAPAWRAKIEGVMQGDMTAKLDTVDKAVVTLFGVYPTKTVKK
ncbi:MAG: DUF4136 domain-containing protein [Bacteroidales bacterium]